jgi:hypothetical protein
MVRVKRYLAESMVVKTIVVKTVAVKTVVVKTVVVKKVVIHMVRAVMVERQAHAMGPRRDDDQMVKFNTRSAGRCAADLLSGGESARDPEACPAGWRDAMLTQHVNIVMIIIIIIIIIMIMIINKLYESRD